MTTTAEQYVSRPGAAGDKYTVAQSRRVLIFSPPVSISPQVAHADELGLHETERAPARVQQRRRHDDVIKAGSDAPQRRLQQRRRPRVDVNAVIVVWAINGAQQTFYALDVTIDDQAEGDGKLLLLLRGVLYVVS